MRDITIVVFVLFIVSWVGILNFMPVELYQPEVSQEYFIPDEFDAWDLLPADYMLENTLNKGGTVVYDFSNYFNTTQKYRIRWNTFITTEIRVEGVASVFFDIGINTYLLEIIDKARLQTSWDNDANVSMVRTQDFRRKIDLYFEDTNTSRNDIGEAYDNNDLNCTIVVATQDQKGEYVSARDLVVALLTYRLPNVLTGVTPLLGFLLSSFIYVPMAFIFFSILVKLLHGGD